MKEVKKKTEYRYFMPVEVIFGRGRRRELISHSLVESAGKILLVTGRHLKKDGTVKELSTNLGTKSLIYEEGISKSSIEAIDKLADFCRQENPDLIVALGGGTILDTTKAAAILAHHPGPVKDYVVAKERVIESTGVPMIALPTTAGTGSEVTPWATVWDLENKKKYSLSSLLMFPKMALVDPELTDSLPAEVTASTGMDALAQAIEAYWSKGHNPVSDVLALRAIRLIMANLGRAVKKPEASLREKVALGSLLSGMAFSNTRTTICHSVSYPMTAHFGIPHGQAVALTLPHFLEYSFKAIEKERQGPLLQAIGGETAWQASQKIESLMKQVGLATHLSQLGIEEKDLDLIVEEGFTPERADNAPKIPTTEELHQILEKIL